MLSSITPLGERARHNRWGVTASWYVVGSLLGGASLGGLLGGIGGGLTQVVRPDDTVVAGAVLATLLIALMFDLGMLGTIPSIRRQVNEDWLDHYRPWVYGGGFGWQLGLGIVTIVPTAGIYATWLLAAMTGSPMGGVMIGGAFGLARALPLLAAHRAVDPTRLRALHRRLSEWGAGVQRATVGVQAVGVAVVTALLLGGGA